LLFLDGAAAMAGSAVIGMYACSIIIHHEFKNNTHQTQWPLCCYV